MNFTASPTPRLPSTTRKMTTTPRYGSKYESKMSARSGSSPVSGGGGIIFTMFSRMSSIPMFALALATTASSVSRPSTSSISLFTSECRGGVQRRQSELKGVEGGD
eukprot:12089-Pelagococcus_subviridis.AAC.2